MQAAVSTIMVLWSVLVPTKMWYAPGQPVTVEVKSAVPVTLTMTDFAGSTVGQADAAAAATVNLLKEFPMISSPGTFVLYAAPRGKSPDDFVGTPVIVQVRQDKRRGAPEGVMVTKLEPLRYVVMSTDEGDITVAFFYDVAPVTVDNFQTLAEQGFYDGLTFHRIIPGYIAQGGDPRGDGSGGPAYQIDAEFNDRPHQPGAISMARSSDPNERHGLPPRPEYANSAGSQFFFALDYTKTKRLDGFYTCFGTVVDGMDVLKKIAATPLADAKEGRPAKPPVIRKVIVLPVTPGKDPYSGIMSISTKGGAGATTGKKEDKATR